MNNIQDFYGVDGGFGVFLHGRFQTLCISKTLDCDDEHGYYNWKKRTECMLWTDDINVAHQCILSAAGESLHTIIVGDQTYDEGQHGRRMVDDFLRKCPDVRSLSVVEDLGTWVSKFGRQLVRLEVASGNPIVAIPTHVLRYLSSRFPLGKNTSLSQFSYFSGGLG